MRKLFILLALAAALWACEENDRLLYDENVRDIYYPIITDTRDSLFVSLLTAETVSTTMIEVKLLGNVLSAPEKFKAQVVKEKSTAVEGVHYEPLPEYFEFPAGEFIYKMPVKLIRGDEALAEKPVTLTLRLVPTAGLGIAYVKRAEIRLLISDMLTAPEGDGYYGDMTAFKSLFGDYSVKKHLMIIELTGHDFWDGDYGVYGIFEDKSYYIPYARKLYKIVTENEILDEHGNIIQGWMVP